MRAFLAYRLAACRFDGRRYRKHNVPINISDCERLTLDQALAGIARVCRVRLLTGGDPLPPRPLLWPTRVEAIDRPHQEHRRTPDVDLYFVRQALVGSSGSHAQLDGQLVYAKGAYPTYVHHYMAETSHPLLEFSTKEIIELEAAFIITHYNFIWGHWLTEIFTKLFCIRLANRLGLNAPIVIASCAPPYIKDIISKILPSQEIVCFDHLRESLKVENLILPHMMQVDYIFHHYLRGELELLGRGSRPRNIYVSRSDHISQHAYRNLENAAELESVANSLGIEIVKPETMSWDDQVSTFAQAELVVGEFGSGLHNTLFSKAGCRVIALNWVGNDVQSRIANFRKHEIGYLLPADLIPRVHQIGQPVQHYTIDAEQFRERASLLMR